MKYIKFLLPFVISGSLLAAPQQPSMDPGYEITGNINVKNTILAKVGDATISVYDVMKKMDVNFNRSFPDLLTSKSARYQFYMTGWQATLEDLINTQLILLDAEKKAESIYAQMFTISETELREEIENRYGPNTMLALDKQNISYSDAEKNIKEEMIMQRAMWFFVRNKAEQRITPQVIRNTYRLYCKKNPTHSIFSYNIISIKSDDDTLGQKVANEALALFKEEKLDPQDAKDHLEAFEKKYPKAKVSISSLYTVNSKEVSASYNLILSKLNKETYSDVICQESRSKKVHRIFYLKDMEEKKTSSFEEIANNLKNELMQKALAEESNKYFQKLRKEHTVEKQNFPKDFAPFEIK